MSAGRTRWGWHRLSKPWASRLVADAGVSGHDLVLDVGAGDGALTALLLACGARVIAIADAYDTITSERTYKKARAPQEAFQELDRCGSAQFDPELVRMFISRLRESPNPLIPNPALAQEPEVFH